MDLLNQKIFIKLHQPNGVAPTDKTSKEYKDWRNKQKLPMGKWGEESSRYTFSEIKDWPNIGMVIPHNYIVVDVDDKEQAEKVHRAISSKNLTCIISNTGKGKHFMFKDPMGEKRPNQTQARAAFGGINIDTRIPGYGDKKGGYVAVKFFPDKDILGNEDGLRFVNLPSMETLSDVPIWLEILRNQDQTIKEVVATRWEEGSRDDNMRSWTTKLWKKEIKNKKSLKEVLMFINDFIMAIPLFNNKAEFDKKVDAWIEWAEKHKVDRVMVLGDEETTPEAFGLYEDNIDYVNIARHMKQLMHIVYYEGNWWMKKSFPWYEKTNDEEIMIEVVKHWENSALKMKQEKFFLALKALTGRTKIDDDLYVINFLNGRYNWKEDILTPYSDNDDTFSTFGIEYNYRRDTQPNIIDETFNQWTQNNVDESMALLEFAGSILHPKNNHTRGVILYGKKAKNGKSTFMNLISNLIKREYITSMNFSQLESRFGAYDLIGKRLIQIGELEDTYIERSPVFKQVITGDYIEVEGKNIKNKIRIEPTVKFIGATNRFPRFGDQTNGIWRRILIIPFDFVPNEKQEKEFDKKKLMSVEAMERLVYLAVEGLKRYQSQRDFTIPARSKELEKQMKVNSNPIHAWGIGEENYDDGNETKLLVNNTLARNYQNYKDWCYNSGYKAVGRNNFKEEIERVFDGIYYWEQSGKGPFTLRQTEESKKEELEELIGKENIKWK